MFRPALVLVLSAAPVAGQAAPDLAPPGQRATRIHVDKSDRRMTLYRGDEAIAHYAVRLGDAPHGHKQREGDERTPEGDYTINGRNPNSRFHLSLRISYPSATDRRRAREGGYPPGGDIMIHGGNAGYRAFDWTDGCIAVTDAEMDRIYALVPNGTPIRIDP